jgi:hypothetical protein
MRTNSRMRMILPDWAIGGYREGLPEDVLRIVEAGWAVGPRGSLLLSALWGGGWRREIDAPEVGRYEYDVNDVYISLSDLRPDIDVYLSRAASRGIAVALRLLEDAKNLPGSDTLLAVVSVPVDMESNDFLLQGTTVRFFTQRGDYPDWFENLERFELDAISVLEMEDAVLH